MSFSEPMPATLDIVIPVYNEGDNIVAVLRALSREVRTPVRVLICYDMPEDNTLPAIRNHLDEFAGLAVEPVRNPGRGAHAAIMAGFAASTAPLVVVFPADDDFNAGILDRMVALASPENGPPCDIVCASRFMPGGTMQGCPWLKAVLVRTAAFTLYYIAQLPTRDATSGFRLFSRRVVDTIAIESREGFGYSIALLVKAHRLGWRIGEVPAKWFERRHGASRFRVLRWLPAYLRWYCYAFATTFLRRPARSVPMVR
jgi:glycosyltransferase involved in cell wall biosynthesis